MSITRSIDNFFTKVLATILKLIAYSFCLILGASTIVLTPIVFLEYQEGIADLDTVEFVLLVLMFGLLWRFWKRGEELHWTVWKRIKLSSIILAVSSIFIGALHYLLLSYVIGEKGGLSEAAFTKSSDLLIIPSFVVQLLCLYAFTPISEGKKLAEGADDVEAKPSSASGTEHHQYNAWTHQSPETQPNGWRSPSSDDSSNPWSKKEA